MSFDEIQSCGGTGCIPRVAKSNITSTHGALKSRNSCTTPGYLWWKHFKATKATSPGLPFTIKEKSVISNRFKHGFVNSNGCKTEKLCNWSPGISLFYLKQQIPVSQSGVFIDRRGSIASDYEIRLLTALLCVFTFIYILFPLGDFPHRD